MLEKTTSTKKKLSHNFINPKYPLYLLIILTFSIPAFAVDEEGRYTIYGQGTRSCGDYVDAVHEVERKGHGARMQWFGSYLTGYLSAVNYYAYGVSDVMDDKDVKGLERWLYNHCRDTPLDSYSDAIQKLVRTLRGLD